MRPFGHPLHPALTHAPIGLLLGAVVWDGVAVVMGPAWWAVSYWTLALGLIAAVPAALTGLLEYAALEDGDPALGPARWHMGVVLAAVALYLTSLIGRSPDGVAPPAWAVALSAAGLAALALGGWLGARLVYGLGVGVDGSARG